MKKDNEKKLCEICGSDQVEIIEKPVSLKTAFGEEATYCQIISICKNCGEEVDITDEKEQINAVKISERKLIKSIIDFIGRQGYSLSHIERALDLPQRTILRWKSGKEPCAAGTTLLKFIRIFPWLIEVADEDFDESYSRKVLIHAAIDEFDNVRYSISSDDPNKKLSCVTVTKNDQETKVFAMAGATYPNVETFNCEEVTSKVEKI
jgi:hypothetical protein